MNRLFLLGVLLFSAIGAGARQEPQPPIHQPKACARPAMKLKDHVGCDCKVVCEKGQRVETPTCRAYCDLSKCACHVNPCCEGHEH